MRDKENGRIAGIPIIYIALGSNINPEKNLSEAVSMLRTIFPAIRFSSVYQTKARDCEDQPDFLNAVATFESEESPESIHEKLTGVEKLLKKNPPYRFGPRTIDIDFLLYGDTVVDSSLPAPHFPISNLQSPLVLPHPRMHERRFVLEPLLELIDPKTLHPTLQQPWSALKEQVGTQECKKHTLNL